MSQTYRVRTDETWAQARAAYGAGEAASSVCRRFDLGLSALRKRASKEGWRRADDPDPEMLEFEDLPDRTPAEAIAHAWRWLCQSLEAGRSAEAVRWLRLHTLLTEARDAKARLDPPRVEARRVDSFHEVHPEKTEPTPGRPGAPAPLDPLDDAADEVEPFTPRNRAERRRFQAELKRLGVRSPPARAGPA